MARRRIGIIGFGKIARDQHVPAIAATPEFELAALSNIGGGTAPDSVAVLAGHDAMLKAVGDLDAVLICSPPKPRRSIAAACLAAGKHVLPEKPPAGMVTEVGTRRPRSSPAPGASAARAIIAEPQAARRRPPSRCRASWQLRQSPDACRTSFGGSVRSLPAA